MPRAISSRSIRALVLAAVASLALSSAAPTAPAKRLGFEEGSAWKPNPSDGVALRVSPGRGREGAALRLDFDFRGHAGWAAVRRPVDLSLPENFRFTLRLRGEAPVNTLEFKLIDPSGENVWWTRKVAWEFPRDWFEVVADRRRLEFAWGPSATRALDRVGAIEITVTAVEGGKGSVWLDELTLEELPPPAPVAGLPDARASSTAPGHPPRHAVDGRSDTAWRSAASGAQSLTLDFGARRELGGVVLEWEPDRPAISYAVETSEDGAAWNSARRIARGNGGRDYLPLPDAGGRFLRLSLERGTGAAYGLREIEIEPPAFGDDPAAVYRRMARDARRGLFPRALSNELAYWTAFGVDGDEGTKPLLSEDGAIETSGNFTLEPFARVDGRLVTWSDVTTAQSLAQEALPLPATAWTHPKLELEVSAFAGGTAADPVLDARYRVRNPTARAERVELFLAVRPLRVTPPWQRLNIPDPTAPIRSLSWRDGRLAVNDAFQIVPRPRPDGVALAAFDEGDASELFDRATGAGASAAVVEDPQRHASALLAWRMELAPGEARDVSVASPLHADRAGAALASKLAAEGPGAAARIEADRAAAVAHWKGVADRVGIDIPEAREMVATARAALSAILLSRDGPAIRGGPRNYDRTWIRDGSLSSLALLRFGFAAEVAAFIRWFAPYQFDDGKVPCCVDRRGADPVPENDSHGEFVYLLASYARLTGDWKLPAEIWPRVESAVAYIDRLRRERRTDAWRAPEKLHFFGLLPESISHEGYSAKPMHSYWDDFWALRGLKDAAWMAERLGRTAAASRFAASRDEFARDLHASVARATAVHRIPYIPGSADLGDFDPTSTTIALEPGGELARLPREAVLATFERYWAEAEARMEGRRPWTAYTPYEVRAVGTFVRLGWRERAERLLAFILDDRRPLAWKNWAEVVAQSYRDPIFVGDIPHTWVASDFVRSFLDMLAYEREEDRALVVGAGLPEGWLAKGVRVRGLKTFYGTLDLDMRGQGAQTVARLGGSLETPPGGIVLALPGRPRRATVNGRAMPVVDGRIVVREFPADVVFFR